MATVEPKSAPVSQNESVLKQLDRILKSEFFRGSQRCSRFLEYSVRQVLDGRPPEDLKERSIGIEVFHRSPDYDTSQNNIVRVTANEVRKRLAQYYGSLGVNETPVISLPIGSYAVTLLHGSEGSAPIAGELLTDRISIVSQHTAPVKEGNRENRRRTLFYLATFALAIAAAGGIYFWRQPADVVRQVWAPLIDSRSPVIVCVAQPMAYRPESDSPTPTGPNDKMVALPDAFVGVGDTYAVANIAGFLSTHHKPWRLLAGNDTPSQDLRSGPLVLVGAYSNPWTSKLMENLRFTFAESNKTDPFHGIADKTQPGKGWSTKGFTPDWKATEDYAIVSRFMSTETGQPVIVLAGLTIFGTQAGGEFLTDNTLLTTAMAHAPKGWEGKNFQFVIHTKIIGKTPQRPAVVAEYFW